MRHLSPTFAASFAALALASLLTGQTPIVVPNSATTTEANTNNSWPWNAGSARIHTMWIYTSSHFSGVTGPVLIQRLRYRADNAFGAATWTGGTYNQVQIDLSTAALPYNAASTTFANNHGLDRSTVVNGAVVMQAGSSAGGGATQTTPGPWYIDIPITVPFVYDPTSGNGLCIDLMVDGTSWVGGSRYFPDHQSSTPACRIHNATSITSPTANGIDNNYGMVVEVTVAPLPPLNAYFTATPRSGGSPMLVSFTDLSTSTAPGGVLSWAWDFDGDNVIDSTLQNPTFNYGCGDFTVSLTVTDAVNPAATLTRTNFVSTDVVTPSFTATYVAANTFLFTDTSTPAPTSWAWDLDGDNITDSTLQNPVWIYPQSCGPMNVSLTVNRNCRGPYTLTKPIVVADTASCSLSGGTSTSSPTAAGCLFDISVNAAEGVSVCALTTTTVTLNGLYNVSVYVAQDTYFGKQTDPSAWRLVATGTATGSGGSGAAPSRNYTALNSPFYLPAGNYGVAVFHTSTTAGTAYIGTTVGSTTVPYTYGNADVTFIPVWSPSTSPGRNGVAMNALFGGTITTPRIWNGSFHYNKTSVHGDAGYGFFGAGCAGTLGVPGNTASALPQLGQTMVANLTNLPLDAAFFIIGFSKTSSIFGPLPFDLAGFGAPGCSARVSSDANLLIVGAAGTASFSLGIPTSSSYLGALLYTQGLVLDPSLNALGASTSDAAAFIIGQ